MQVTNDYQFQALSMCVVCNVKDKVEYGKDEYDCAPYILSFTNDYQLKDLSYKIVSIIDALGDLISPGEMCRIPEKDLYHTCTLLYDDPAIDLVSKSDNAFCTGISKEIYG